MKNWQKILLDPGSFIILKQIQDPKTTEEISKTTGIRKERTQKILEKLEENNLIQHQVQKGTRKYQLKNNNDKIRQLRLEIEEHTTLEIEKLAKKGELHLARQKIHRKPIIKDIHKRRSIAKIEALQKLKQLNNTQKNQREDLISSLKNSLTRA